MLKVATVTPPSGFAALEASHCGYHLVLAQHLLTDERYREFYRLLAKYGHYIICDNGAAERDQPPFDEVVAVANYIGADEIVLPDVVCDREATFEALERWQATWKQLPPARRFIVPQGKTPDEWFSSYYEIYTYVAAANTVGVSKYFPGNRAALLHLIGLRVGVWSHHVHVLGLTSSHPYGEVARIATEFPWVRGVDSGAAIAWAQQGLYVEDVPDRAAPRYSLDWTAPIEMRTAQRNIEELCLAGKSRTTEFRVGG